MISIYPEYILKKLRQREGLEPNDTSMDDMLNGLSPEIVFKEVCDWEGMIGYSSSILGWIEDIYGIDLNQCAEQAKKHREFTEFVETL